MRARASSKARTVGRGMGTGEPDLAAAARFARRRNLLAGALGGLVDLALGTLILVGLLSAARQRLANPPAHRLLLGLVGRGFTLGLGSFGGLGRIVLAADELDLRHGRVITAAMAEAQHPGIAARPLDEPGRDRLEQLLHDLAIGDVAADGP